MRPCPADHCTEKVLKVLARKKDISNRKLVPRRMDTLTNEEALLSVSRSAATPTSERPIHDTSDNLDTIPEVDYKADDSGLVPPVGAQRKVLIASPCTY